MTVLVAGLVTIGAGLLTFLTYERRRVALAIAGVATIATFAVATRISPADPIVLAGTVVAGSDWLRVIAVTWAASVLLLGLADVLVGSGGVILGPSLIALGTCLIGLAVADPGIGFALVTAGGLAAAIGPLPWLVEPDRAALGRRWLRPIAASGLIGLAAVAWAASPVGPFGVGSELETVDPGLEVATGLALLAVAAAVTIRLGAIPAHAWAARLSERLPAAAVPSALGWSAAAFALVALGWVDVAIEPAPAPLLVERRLIALVAIASIVLAGLAALVHDDIEHVLGYSLVQDAGVSLLALSVLRPEAATAGRDWLVGIVAVKAGFWGWVLVTRAAFRVRRLSELRGWARSAPALGLALAVATVGAVGLPGMATFEARGVLVRLAVPAPLDGLVLLAAFAPVAYLGRILVLGVDRRSEAAWAAASTMPTLGSLRPGGWTGLPLPAVARSLPRVLEANRFAIAALAVVAVAVIGLIVAGAGAGAGAVTSASG